VDLFDQYAELAFQTGPGFKNPVKPTQILQELGWAADVGPFIRDAVQHFIQQHIEISNNSSSDALRDTYHTKFEKLFNIGVFSFEVSITDENIVVNLQVWNGNQYELASDILNRIFPAEPPREYDLLEGMEPGE
jgi:hypothetical protein